MNKKIIILILLFLLGICFSYNIIEGVENAEAEPEAPELTRFKELNAIITGKIPEGDEENISINDFYANLNNEKCKAAKDIIDLVNNGFSDEPGVGNESITELMGSEMPHSSWASIFSYTLAANTAATLILKKDTRCGLLNYINDLRQDGPSFAMPFGGGGQNNKNNNNNNNNNNKPKTDWLGRPLQD